MLHFYFKKLSTKDKKGKKTKRMGIKNFPLIEMFGNISSKRKKNHLKKR